MKAFLVGVILSVGFLWLAGCSDKKKDTMQTLAEQGDAKAQFSLGSSYSFDTGVEKDELEAYAWYNLAAIKEGNAVLARDGMEKFLAPEAILAGQKRSKELRTMIDARMKSGK